MSLLGEPIELKVGKIHYLSRGDGLRQLADEVLAQVGEQRHVDGSASDEQGAHQALGHGGLICPANGVC